MTVVNKRTHKPDENTVYIGRGSKWGNPYTHMAGTKAQFVVRTRDAAVTAYAEMLDKQIASGEVSQEELAALHGKDLMCYCAPQRCHGHVLEVRAARAHQAIEAEKPMNLKPARVEKYRLIVAGGRDFTDVARAEAEILALLDQPQFEHKDVELVSGMARGADACGVQIAEAYGAKLHKFPADWDRYGKRAGYLRNEQMAEHSQGLILFWDGKSRGSKHMLDIARRKGLDVHVVYY